MEEKKMEMDKKNIENDMDPNELERRRQAARRRRARERARRRRRFRRILAFSMLFGLILLVSLTVFAVKKIRNIDITLSASSATILQGEELPTFKAEAVCVKPKKEKKRLDRKEDYRVSDLIKELNSGKGYTIECEADNTVEGSYAVEIELTEEMQKQLKKEWKRVTLNVQNGKLTVKNKVGEWDGDQFKRWDGTYVKSDFVESKGEIYYFDKEGNKVTGTQQIGFAKCEFDENGKLVSKESSIDPNKPMMALTFDDGPGERTDELLEVLNKYNAHATFFMLGEKIEGQEKIIEKMVQIGCELGNHSYDHPALSGLDASGVQKQMSKTNDLLVAACGKSATVMRPPYGDYAGEAQDNVGLPIILWNVDTLDWDTMDTQSTINAVKEYADDGDIVLLHDIHSPTIDAVLELVPYLIGEGYQLVTVSELAEARGLTLENGVMYTDFNL